MIRRSLEKNRPIVAALAQKLRQARQRLNSQIRKPRPHAPAVQAVFDLAAAVDELWRSGVGPDDRPRIQTLMDELLAPGTAAGRANAAITACLLISAAGFVLQALLVWASAIRRLQDLPARVD